MHTPHQVLKDQTPSAWNAGLAHESLARLQERAQRFRLGERYPVTQLPRNLVYVVSKGVAAIECTMCSGERTVTTLLYPGDILIPDLQAPLPDLALIAHRPVEFWKMTIVALAQESSHDCLLWQTIFLRLGAQNARTEMHAAARSALNREERIAGFLIEIATRLGVKNGSAVSFDLPLSRYSIAAYLSLNADTVSRTLSEMMVSKTIERRGRFHMSILDWNAILAMCPLAEAIVKLHEGCEPLVSPTHSASHPLPR